ncbi:hypothetical protein AYO40_03685 [Planctomycetaceae bacterium SCGC AG-212-D15]|nr:hypothetical protein AYO40_03685 [Planctomycetaceae bacterium SCGC AG-212-D15]
MKILFISFPFPWPLDSGARQRRYHLVQELARRHEVTLLTLLPRDRPEEESTPCPVDDLCKRVIEIDVTRVLPVEAPLSRWQSIARNSKRLLTESLPRVVQRWQRPALINIFRSVYRSDDFDAVWVDRYYFGEVARRAGIPRFVVDVDDVESVALARSLRASEWRRAHVFHYAELGKLRCYERTVPRRFWRAVVCKEQDRFLFSSSRHRVYVVPNGIAEQPLAPSQREQAGEILFIGTLDYRPNIDAVHYFHGSVFPDLQQQSPGCRFQIVGRNPMPEVLQFHDGASVFVHGNVPNITPHYETAAVVVAPIRLGSGTRLKVLEALGRGKALVATSTAIEGLELRPGIDVEVADDSRAFSRVCARLLASPQERRQLGLAGRQRVAERYGWSRIGRIAEEALTPAGREAVCV